MLTDNRDAHGRLVLLVQRDPYSTSYHCWRQLWLRLHVTYHQRGRRIKRPW